jgi:hypothetical protein
MSKLFSPAGNPPALPEDSQSLTVPGVWEKGKKQCFEEAHTFDSTQARQIVVQQNHGRSFRRQGGQRALTTTMHAGATETVRTPNPQAPRVLARRRQQSKR